MTAKRPFRVLYRSAYLRSSLRLWLLCAISQRVIKHVGLMAFDHAVTPAFASMARYQYRHVSTVFVTITLLIIH
jgi:hypothetical protein